MSSRKVSRVWLQSPIDVPGLPGATTQLSPEKTPKVTMYLSELGLEVSQGKVTAFIPVANVKVAIYAEESKAK